MRIFIQQFVSAVFLHCFEENVASGQFEYSKKLYSIFGKQFFIFTVNKFNFSYRRQILSPKKVYCIDGALARVLGFLFPKIMVGFWKILFLELKEEEWKFLLFERQWQRNRFLSRGKTIKINSVIQVCWSLADKDTREREIDGKEALIELKLNKGFILTDNEEEEVKLGGKIIMIMPTYKWLLLDKIN